MRGVPLTQPPALIGANPAHQHTILQLTYLEAKKTLVTLGLEDASHLSATLKVWLCNHKGRPDKAPAAANPTQDVAQQAPLCLKTIKVFTTKAMDTELLCMAVHGGSWPQAHVAIGTRSGNVLVLHGDFVRDKLQRANLVADPHASPTASQPISDVGFTGQDGKLFLYAVTEKLTLAFNVANGARVVLDEAGAAPGCSTLDSEGELVVGRPEAVYFYSPDGRGPCFVFEGQKHQLHWLDHYLVAASSQDMGSVGVGHTLQLYDMRNKLIAASLSLAEKPRQILCRSGLVLIPLPGGHVIRLQEKGLAAKLELLFTKSLYPIALNMARFEQADEGIVARIQQRYGDHLHARGDYDGAMSQYMATMGHLEASYVIRKFLDAQRIHNLTAYLEQLHEKGLATADHTTLLLNCYTKAKDVDKLDRFLKGAERQGASGTLPFSIDTAVKVCRAAGYFEHALDVAKAAGEHELYLDILLEDCSGFDEALTYLQTLPASQAASVLQKHGKALINGRPEETTALLMRLCTSGEGPGQGGEPAPVTAQVADFAHLFADRPQALMLLCEFVLNSLRSPPSEALLYHTLLELYLNDGRTTNTGPEGDSPTASVSHQESSSSGEGAGQGAVESGMGSRGGAPVQR
ncbi:hypothetical protein WJX84_001767 [Apatococcus fuscideae]|uniref:PEP5/VPS11 N-terminal domain-containing protein n=1 Tax=Apatococcus fuscideae TaxID=2026836 RepID=A0AAW1S9G5_9CHLO